MKKCSYSEVGPNPNLKMICIKYKIASLKSEQMDSKALFLLDLAVKKNK